MSKRKSGNIPVEIIELKPEAEGYTLLEIRVKDDPAGEVKELPGKQALVTLKSGKQQKVQTMDEGIQAVLMDYNLHNL